MVDLGRSGMSDHRELIEQVRKEHAERPVTRAYPLPICGWDMERWPCLATRLADALEHSIAYAINHGAEMRLERDAALARLAQAECGAWHCSGQRRCELEGGHAGRHFTTSLGDQFGGWEDSASTDVPRLLDALTEARAQLAAAERERDDKDRQLDEALGQCVALGLDLEGIMRERAELRGHYDAVREQVGVVTQRLAEARTALAVVLPALEWMDRWGQDAAGMAVARTLHIDFAGKAATLLPVVRAALGPSPTPCASCGQDPVGGHNRGCPDGAGLGGGAGAEVSDE